MAPRLQCTNHFLYWQWIETSINYHCICVLVIWNYYFYSIIPLQSDNGAFCVINYSMVFVKNGFLIRTNSMHLQQCFHLISVSLCAWVCFSVLWTKVYFRHDVFILTQCVSYRGPWLFPTAHIFPYYSQASSYNTHI